MKLKKLTLKNFKGLRSFTLDAQGEDIDVYGDNATGKTTIFDAFLWLLFGKDSKGKSDFAIKTLDEDNEAIPGLDHEVEGVFEIGGKTVTLRKVYAEKWTKKRGSVKPEFTGHTTDYFLDGVPVQKKEYDAYISQIADEDIFKLLTSPMYFNEQLHWQERRKILLQVCGDLTDEEVIASDKALARLPDILQGRKLEDHRKVIAARRAEINKELEKIPVRIDETERGLPDIQNLGNEKLMQSALMDLKADEKRKQQELVRIQSGGEIAEKQKQLREIEAEILKLKNELNAENDAEITEKRRLYNDIEVDISILQREIGNLNRDISDNLQQINRLNMSMDELRADWSNANKEEFAFEQDDTCPTCGQALPEEQLDEARDKALKDFNRKKAERLEAITQAGKAYKAKVESLTEENTEIRQEIDRLQKELEAKLAEGVQFKAEISKLQDGIKDPRDNPEYAKLQEEKETAEMAIESLRLDAKAAIEQVERELSEVQQRMALVGNDILSIKQHEKGQERIRELKAQEKELAAEYEKLEGELYLTEQFIRTKVGLLEQKINSKFRMARFKLFNVLVNGGVEECCETLYSGVPYSSGLNNAACFNVGLDIINTLAEHYGFAPPIFVDNAEAVTQLIETRGQMIKLIVSEPDMALRVESSGKTKMKEAI